MSTAAGADRLVDYLLGTASPQERERIQEQLFTEDGFEEELLATADELIHAYLVGELDARQRSRFESHFLASPRHRERLTFIEDLTRAAAEVAAEESQPFASGEREQQRLKPLWLVAAVLAVLVSSLPLLLRRNVDSERTPIVAGPSPAAKTPAASSSAAAPASSASARPTSPSARPAEPDRSPVRTVRLPRSSEAPIRIAVRDDTELLRVEVPVPVGPPSFDASLSRRGDRVWSAEEFSPPPAGRPLVVEIPAQILRAEDYVLRIEGDVLRDASPPRLLEYRIRVARER
jgi:anti-sigma factor RsiW